jgi:hypothetical protein
MQQLEAQKFVAITPPGAIVDDNPFTTAAIDTLGFDELLIVVFFGALDIVLAALKLQESDDSGMSGAVDISGADLSVAANGVLPPATADNTFIAFHVRCGGQRKRYIDLVMTGGNGSVGTYAAAFALLGKGKSVPTTATQRGAGQFISIL